MLLQPTTTEMISELPHRSPSDRRAHPRIPRRDLRVTRVRIANRPAVSLVDLSSGGALLSLPFRARPESRFAVQLQTPLERIEVPIQLLRIYVADIRDGVTYHAAGAFDSLLDLEALAQPVSDPVPRLIAALERLHAAGRKSAIQTPADAEFTETLGGVVDALRRGERVDQVARQIKTWLTHTYPSLTIVPSQSSGRDSLMSVDAFGYSFTSISALSVHDRRVLKSNAQLMSMLEACCAEMCEESVPPTPQLVHSAADWTTTQSTPATSVGLTLDDILKAEAGGYRYGAAALALRG
jgi:hypothetical protein